MASVIKQALGVPYTFGGEPPSGWVPSGAAPPLPTPEERVLLDITIEATDGGVLLRWEGPEPEQSGDRWYETVEEAEADAHAIFGIGPTDWSPAA